MRFLRICGWSLLGLFAFLILCVGAIWLGGAPAMKWLVEHPVSTAMGRQIRIAGPLHIEPGATTRIVLEDVHVANFADGSEPEMLSARQIELELVLHTLISGPLRLPMLQLDGAKLLLETNQSGEGNWKFGARAAAPQKRQQYPDLRHMTLSDSQLLYRNGETKAESRLAVQKLDLDAPDPAAPIAIAGNGTFQERPLALFGSVGAVQEMRDTSKPYPVKLVGQIAQARFAIDGQIGEPLDFAGLQLRLGLDGKRLDEVADLFGVPLGELPDFRGTAVLTGGDAKFQLEAMSLKLGKSDLEGGLAIDATARLPHLEAKFTASSIDLADFKGMYGGRPAHSTAPSAEQKESGKVLPTTSLKVEKLPGINIDLSLDAARVLPVAGLPVDRLVLGLTLRDGVLTVRPLRFHTAQGDFDLNFQLASAVKDAPPHLRADIDIRHVDLHKLFGVPAMPQMMQKTAGMLGGFIKIDTNGTSMHDFLGRMNGDAGVFVENGQFSDLLQNLAPLNVLGALGVYVSGDKPVPINCIVARFNIRQGVATSSTMLLDTKDTEIVGDGSVNFATEQLSFTLNPRNKTLTIVSLRTPVEVGGTLAKPDYTLHPEGLVARLGAAIGLGILAPPAALLPLIDTGLGENNACSKAYAKQAPPGEGEKPAGPRQQQR